MTVKSKYKNPDKYIKRLKADIARLKYSHRCDYAQLGQDIESMKHDAGERVFTYTEGGIRLGNSLALGLGKRLRIGATMMIEGRITALEIKGGRVDFRMNLRHFNQVEL